MGAAKAVLSNSPTLRISGKQILLGLSFRDRNLCYVTQNWRHVFPETLHIFRAESLAMDQVIVFATS